MSEPPPRPLDTIAPRPGKLRISHSPCSPSRGRQNASVRTSRGVRGNEPGGYGRPRSSSSTLRPARARRHAVTDPPNPEPTTIASNGSAAIDLPRDRVARVGLVAAEVAGVDGRLELAPERLVLGRDAADHALHRAGHVHPCALGVRGRLAVAAAEPDRARQLVRDELHLLAGAGGALGVVERLDLLDLGAEVLETAAVLALGLRVEQRARVAVAGAARLYVAVARRRGARAGRGVALGGADDVDGVELDAGVVEQQREVAQALGVLDV